VLNNLPAPQQTDCGVFSLSCLKHCTSMGPSFWNARIENASFASTAGAWFYSGLSGQKVMGNCETYQRCVFC